MTFTTEELEEFITKYFMNSPVKNYSTENNTSIQFDLQQDFEKYNEESNKPIIEDIIFKYLESDSLTTDIEYQRDYLKNYEIHICLYNIEQTTRLPFIKYGLIENNKTYNFPSENMDMRPFIEIMENKNKIAPELENEEGELSSEIDIEFMNQINQIYKKYTTKELNNKECYKGFLENDNNQLYVFIDNTNEGNNLELEFCIIDEILNTGIIRNTPIHNNIIELFKNNIILQRMQTIEGIDIQFPKIGYICDLNDKNEYTNAFKNDKDNVYLIPPSISHDEYDDIYIFSSIPLTITNINTVNRFACFVENIETSTADDKDNLTFEENNILFYGLYEMDLFKEL